MKGIITWSILNRWYFNRTLSIYLLEDLHSLKNLLCCNLVKLSLQSWIFFQRILFFKRIKWIQVFSLSLLYFHYVLAFRTKGFCFKHERSRVVLLFSLFISYVPLQASLDIELQFNPLPATAQKSTIYFHNFLDRCWWM